MAGGLVSQGFLRIFENGAVVDLEPLGAAAGIVSPEPGIYTGSMGGYGGAKL